MCDHSCTESREHPHTTPTGTLYEYKSPLTHTRPPSHTHSTTHTHIHLTTHHPPCITPHNHPPWGGQAMGQGVPAPSLSSFSTSTPAALRSEFQAPVLLKVRRHSQCHSVPPVYVTHNYPYSLSTSTTHWSTVAPTPVTRPHIMVTAPSWNVSPAAYLRKDIFRRTVQK